MKLVCKLKSDVKRKQQRRQDFRLKLVKTYNENPTLAKDLKTFNSGETGRPRVEADHPELLSTIIKIVENQSTADNRRRTENLRTVKTLADLTKELHQMEHTLSRSAVYLRFKMFLYSIFNVKKQGGNCAYIRQLSNRSFHLLSIALTSRWTGNLHKRGNTFSIGILVPGCNLGLSAYASYFQFWFFEISKEFIQYSTFIQVDATAR